MADHTMQNNMLRRLQIILCWAGLALVAAGVALDFMAAAGPALPALLTGVGLAALGLNILLGGDLVAGPEPRAFTARGQVARGYLEVGAGLADLSLEAGESDRIASVRFGPFGRPAFRAEGGVARLGLRNPPLLPNIARWQAALAGNVLWDIEARSSLGDLRLDLFDLRLETVWARTLLGRIEVTCPVRGYTRMHLGSAAGEIELIVPPGVGAQITLRKGELASVAVENERLMPLGPHRYVTADYDTALVQVEVAIHSTAGDVILS